MRNAIRHSGLLMGLAVTAIVLSFWSSSHDAFAKSKFKGTIKVGIVSDLTGVFQTASNIQGALAYFDKVNAAGGVDGYKIVPSQYDTTSSQSGAVQAIRRAIAARPAAVVGASFAASPGLPTLAQSGIPAVGDGFAPGWTGHRTLFSVDGDVTTHLSDVYFVVLKKYAGASKIALLGAPLLEGDLKNLAGQASRAGVQLVMQDFGLPDVLDAPTALSVAEQIKSSGAQGVVDIGEVGVQQLQTDLNQLNAHVTVLVPQFTPATADENGALYDEQWANPYIKGDPGVTTYIKTMKKYGYGSVLYTASFAPFRYAQAALLVQGLEKAGPPFAHAAVVKALSTTKRFTAGGMIPPASFPQFQKVGTHCQSVMQVVNGQWKGLTSGPSPFICGGPSLADPTS